jgi:hypothetical protein
MSVLGDDLRPWESDFSVAALEHDPTVGDACQAKTRQYSEY